MIDGYRSKRVHVDAECVQVLQGLATEELATYLVARCGLALDESNASSFASESDGSGTARHATTEDENLALRRRQ
jgi:hypothetical protein